MKTAHYNLKREMRMLAFGMIVALVCSSVRAEIAPVTESNRATEESQAPRPDMNPGLAAAGNSGAVQVTYTVVLPSGGNTMRLLFTPTRTGMGWAAGSATGGFVKVHQVAPRSDDPAFSPQ